MPRRKNFALVSRAVVICSVVAAGYAPAVAQDDPLRPDLAGHWELNRELSENAQTALERMHSSQSDGHGPGRHGGFLGRLFGGGHDSQTEEARARFLNAPTSFTLKQESDRIMLTESDGRARTLTANGRKERVNGRDVQTRWDKDRLVTETSLGNAKITETYERSTNLPRLTVTTKMEMRGHDVSVRRVYEAAVPR